jgi:putative FmdB family regulatory protein
MPILKYKCDDCGKEFAKIFFKPEDAPRDCPVCGERNIKEIGAAFDYDRKSMDRLMCPHTA